MLANPHGGGDITRRGGVITTPARGNDFLLMT
jgi:hypothetical protein